MRTKFGNILWGLFFIAIGAGLVGNLFGLWNFTLFFDGWWTLFIIIPCVISMVQHSINLGNLLGLAAGVLLLMGAQDVIDFGMVWKLLLALAFVLIGLNIMFTGVLERKWRAAAKQAAQNAQQSSGGAAGSVSYTAVFNGQQIRYPRQPFASANVVCIFGGVDLDLRDAVIDRDITITLTCVFGGCDIFLPPNVEPVLGVTGIFGGCDNKTAAAAPGSPRAYIGGTCVFGGADIK